MRILRIFSVSLMMVSALSAGRFFAPMRAVDAASGSDSNNGTVGSPWATVAHAASVLPYGPALLLKYPDGTFRTAPPVWQSIVNYWPYSENTGTAIHDIASGKTCSTSATPGTWSGQGLTAAVCVASGTTIVQPDTVVVGLYRCSDSTSGRKNEIYDGTGSSTRQTVYGGSVEGPAYGCGPLGGNTQKNTYAGVGFTFTGSTITPAMVSAGWTIFSNIYNGSSSLMYEGNSSGTGNAGTNSLSAMTIGASNTAASVFDGTVSGLTTYSSGLSSGNVAAYNTWWNNVEGPRIHFPSGMSLNQAPLFSVPTPLMGGNWWYPYEATVSETIIKAQADALVSSGLAAKGYTYVDLDDGWAAARDGSGNIGVNGTLFPSGMASLASYVHGKSLKFGIYTSPGSTTCLGLPGSFGHEAQDASTYAGWGVDFIKYDGCSVTSDYSALIAKYSYQAYQYIYQKMARGILLTGRTMPMGMNDTFSLVGGWETAFLTGANVNRQFVDLNYGDWSQVVQQINNAANYVSAAAAYSVPNQITDWDIMTVDKLISNDGMTLGPAEGRSEMTMWSIAPSQLLIGDDITTLSATALAIYGNTTAIAVNQDPLALGVSLLNSATCGSGVCRSWAKKLNGTNKCALAATNTDSASHSITVTIPSGQCTVTTGFTTIGDAWSNSGLSGTINTSFSVTVPAHDAVLVTLGP